MKRPYILFLIGSITFFSCQEDFLEKYPLTSVSPETFFKKEGDFKLYVNQFYDGLGDYTGFSIGPNDLGTDNQVDFEPDTQMNGEGIKEVEDNNWASAYRTIRNINILLENTDGVEFESIKTYVGEARFFRAWAYFNLLQRFGGVPWINEPLFPTDRDKLKTPRSPRNVVADSIIADLDFAIANLPSITEAEELRLNREVALALKSRVALYEGTWEKYHGREGTPFQVNGADGTKYLQFAMDAANEVINSGKFAIDKSGDEPYFDLFSQEDYSNSQEVMLWRKNDRDLRQWNVERQIMAGLGGVGGLTKNFIGAYLATDGLPISLTSLTVTVDSLPAVVQNRDPRLSQSIYNAGMPRIIDDASGNVMEYFLHPDLTRIPTGYHYRKHGSFKASLVGSNNIGQLAHIYFRYGEVLLNYIEAKAELYESGGASLSQNDFDISINRLRDRMEMPHFDFNVPIVDPDHAFTGKIPWYLVEIRRERRVELLVEGFRKDDIFRWAAADELIKGKIFEGAPFQWYLDRGFYEENGQITRINDEGLLSPWHGTQIDLQGGYNFNLGRDYLYPIPLQEELLGEYENNPGWD